MSIETWSSLSVYDFFRSHNWTEKTTELEFFDGVELIQNSQSLFSLNLKNFLRQSNWQGYKKANYLSQSIQPLNESLFNLSVNNFFRRMRWETPPEIAPMSKNSLFASLTNDTSSDFNLNNLSDLF